MTVGSAFDLTARRNETDYQRISDNVERVIYQIEINNSKSEDQSVAIVEHLYGEWEMVPARGTKLVTYTVERRF